MNLFRALSIYTMSSLLGRAVPFFLLPIMTKYLTPGEYGEVSIYIVLVTFLSTVMYWGAHVHIGIEYFKMAESDYRKLLGRLSLIALFMFFITSLIFFFVNAILNIETFSPYLFLSIPIASLFGYLYRLMTVHFRVSNQQYKFAFTEVSTSLLQVLFSIAFVVFLSYGVQGRVGAIVLSSLFISGYLLFYIKSKRLMEFDLNFNFYANYFKSGLAYVFNELGNQIIRIGDKFLIMIFMGPSFVGPYAVAAQVASIALILNSVFIQAWQPYVFKILSSNSSQEKRKLYTLTLVIIGAFILIYLALDAISIVIYDIFIDIRYHESLPAVKWLLAGFFFTFIYGIFADYMFFSKQIKNISLVTLFNLVLFVIFSVLFMAEYGAFGVAYAFSLSSLSSTILCAYLSYKCDYSLFKLKREAETKK
ncbi:lipopolysaccharide biosynthesis protein [Aeromonas media]|uniref:lipopolysaccharide biosynthesis protein n=1 Tax=Aeromonas media TaxID=651 RepID=UPI0029D51C39|nr:oligosaccharide flippase family protein [Aeromonas media]MDX7899831.1 oligosaccharide flippase family protein [Aeromonas media]